MRPELHRRLHEKKKNNAPAWNVPVTFPFKRFTILLPVPNQNFSANLARL